MKLNPQQQAIYNYLRDNGEATIVQLRNALFIAKPCMRCAEINRMYRAENGEDLIVTVRKKKNGEHIKALSKPLTRKVSRFEYTENGVREVVELVEV